MRSPFRSLFTSALTTYTGGSGGGSSSKRTLSSQVLLQEISIPTADGTVLAAQRWTKRKQDSTSIQSSSSSSFDRTILCTHGWLDNCGSHYYLAPRLAMELEDNVEIIAMDFPGHGHSSHKSKDAPPMVQADLVYYMYEAIQHLLLESSSPEREDKEEDQDFMDKWTTTGSSDTTSALDNNNNDDKDDEKKKKKVTLLGHSLGAGVASLTAASFPELIDQVVLLDAATFLPREAKDTAHHVRQHILRRYQHDESKPPRVYPNLERAIQVRQFSATKMPGNQSLSHEAAKAMVERGTRRIVNDQQVKDEEKKEDDNDSKDKAVQFRHDPRFTWPSIQYMTWEQNEGILAALYQSNIDVCIIQAENGWPVDDYIMKRLQEILQPRVLQKLPGTHHFHANPETAQAVGDAVLGF